MTRRSEKESRARGCYWRVEDTHIHTHTQKNEMKREIERKRQKIRQRMNK